MCVCLCVCMIERKSCLTCIRLEQQNICRNTHRHLAILLQANYYRRRFEQTENVTPYRTVAHNIFSLHSAYRIRLNHDHEQLWLSEFECSICKLQLDFEHLFFDSSCVSILLCRRINQCCWLGAEAKSIKNNPPDFDPSHASCILIKYSKCNMNENKLCLCVCMIVVSPFYTYYGY